jgi:hypothetical protein
MREKVTDSWRWNGNGGNEKVVCDIAEELAAPAAHSGAALRDGRPEDNGPPLKLCRRIAKKGSEGLGRKADFSYCNAMKAKVS